MTCSPGRRLMNAPSTCVRPNYDTTSSGPHRTAGDGPSPPHRFLVPCLLRSRPLPRRLVCSSKPIAEQSRLDVTVCLRRNRSEPLAQKYRMKAREAENRCLDTPEARCPPVPGDWEHQPGKELGPRHQSPAGFEGLFDLPSALFPM